MDPYFFYSGFSDRWYEKFLTCNGLKIETMEVAGDYYSWLAVEMFRTSTSHSFLAKLALAPAFFIFTTKEKRKHLSTLYVRDTTSLTLKSKPIPHPHAQPLESYILITLPFTRLLSWELILLL